MAGKHKLRKAYQGLDVQKADEINPIPGILGFLINGERTVEVQNRNGYVYVRLRDNLSEVCQAYNDNVSPVYGLPVLMVRDSTNRTRYRIIGRDLGRYQDWGTSSPYLPRHGAQHSFNPPDEGGDITWVYGRQLMPLLVYPSGSYGAGNVLISPYTFYRDNTWHYAGGTGTASFLPYKPTGAANAKMVLLYINDSDAPAYVAGNEFSASLTGTVQIYSYIPSLPTTSGLPLAGIRLVTGTTVILWDNIYDLRPWIVGDSFIPTGTVGHVIADEGVSLPTQPILDFLGPGVGVRNGSGRTEVIVSGTSSGGSLPDQEVAFGDGSSIISDAEFLYSQSDQSLTIGRSTVNTGHRLSVFGEETGNWPLVGIFGYGTGTSPTIETHFAQGTIAGSRTTTAGGNQLTDFIIYAYATGSAGSFFLKGLEIEAYSLQPWSTNSANTGYSPTYLQMSIGSSGTAALTKIFKADKDDIDLSTNLNVSGTMRPGAFQLRAGATNGYVLTSDANGIGTWQVAGAGTQGPPGAGISAVFDDGVFKVSGTAISFDTNLSVSVTGSVAFVSSSGGTGGNPSIATAFSSSTDSHSTNNTYEYVDSMIVSGTVSSANTKLLCQFTGMVIPTSANWEHFGFRFILNTGTASETYYQAKDANPSNSPKFTFNMHSVFESVPVTSYVVRVQWHDDGSNLNVNITNRRLTVMLCQ